MKSNFRDAHPHTRRSHCCRGALIAVVLAACTGEVNGGRPTTGPGAGGSSNGGSGPASGTTAGSGGTRNGSTAGGGSSGSGAAACRYDAPKIRRLTPRELQRTVAALLPGTTLDTSGIQATLTPVPNGFSNDATPADLSGPNVDKLLTAADGFADAVAASAQKFATCAKTSIDAACARSFVAAFVTKAFRRPLATDEADAFATFLAKQAQSYGAAEAVKQLARAAFLSPDFLFRTELGDGAADSVRLTDVEKASALSYFITGGPPDDALMSAASKGELASAAGLRTHAERLLNARDTGQGIVDFFGEQFGVARVSATTKDATTFPEWTPSLAGDMANETLGFVAEVLFNDDGKLSTLMSAPYSVLNARLATHYGVSGVTGDGFRKVAMPAPRAGLMTQGSFLASVAKPKGTDAVRRGLQVVQRFLCTAVPPPPANLANAAVPPKSNGTETQRTLLATHRQNPICAGCHKLSDPAGLALESFDSLGRYRTMDNGNAIDPSGALPPEVVATPVSFGDAREMARALSSTPEATACMASRLLQYEQGRKLVDADACAVDELAGALKAADGDVKKLIMELVASDRFATRTN